MVASAQRIVAEFGSSQFLESTSEFPEKFNEETIAIKHRLAGNPLFELPRLRELARMLVEKYGSDAVTCLTGNKGVDASWDDLEEAIDQLDASFENLHQRQKAWIVLKKIVADPDYEAVMTSLIDQVAESLGPRGPEITWPEPYLFISSPGFTTPYHIDHEAGLLMQIGGTKVLKVFDGRDRDVLSLETIEKFYLGGMSAAKISQDYIGKGQEFSMVPGDGVCFPGLAPTGPKPGTVAQ